MRPFQSGVLAIPHTPTPTLLSLTEPTGMAMILDSILGLALLMLLILALVLLFVCKPWRFFFSSYRSRTIKVSDLERPLVPEDLDLIPNQNNELERSYDLEGSCVQSEAYLNSPRTHGLVHKQRIPPAPPHLVEGGSVILDVIADASEDVFVGQTLKRPFMLNNPIEEQTHIGKEELSYELKFDSENHGFQESVRQDIVDQRSSLTLEVISGPSRGDQCSISSANTSRLPLTLGRVSPSDLLVKDSEVSGKHALINWNLNKLKWELVDMGSLNGTLLNSQSVNHPDSGRRHWGDPIELASGDIITLGTTSKIYVQIASETKCQVPFGLGIASDPMALRRGGKKLPMEDVCYYQWPLPGADKFGLFGICDGHGGAAAAKSASKILPEMVSSILSDSLKREKVLSQNDASEVLRDALLQTETFMNHHYEGCTATVLLVWTDGFESFSAQCANVGDSACVMNVDGKQLKMTEDHRVTSFSERQRIKEIGEPLKDGETRLSGLNLARMLGDKYMKEQDSRFSSEPYISRVVHINKASKGFALLASDGFWDVISPKKAIQLVFQMKERSSPGGENSAEKIAKFLLSEARTLRTKDNTTIIFLDFDSNSRKSFCKLDP